MPTLKAGSGTASRRRYPEPLPWPKGPRGPLLAFGIGLFVLCLFFYRPLLDLYSFARYSELYSYILLIPFVTAYLASLKKDQLPWSGKEVSRKPAIGLFAIGMLYWGFLQFAGREGWQPDLQDTLFFWIICFVLNAIACGILFLGIRYIKAVAFPAVLLFFLAPFPTLVEDGIEVFFQRTSADAAHALFVLSGISVFREGLKLQIPGIVLEVARECSGIRSSLVLFISSLVAGYLFLRSPSRRLILTLFVIPLGILRNGFRILTIGWLCVHVSPKMIDSWIHRKGGPLFFVLSLIPFFVLLLGLQWSEKRKLARSQGEDRTRI